MRGSSEGGYRQNDQGSGRRQRGWQVRGAYEHCALRVTPSHFQSCVLHACTKAIIMSVTLRARVAAGVLSVTLLVFCLSATALRLAAPTVLLPPSCCLCC